MAFPRAKVKRFNEITTCAPPPGHYDPKSLDKVQGPLLNSKDERFKDPKESPSSNLGLLLLDRPERTRSSSVSSTHSSRLGLSPSKSNMSAAPSVESLASLQSETGIVRKSGIPVCKILPPAEYAKIKELERQLKVVLQERNTLHKTLQIKSEDFLKLESRFQICVKEKVELEGNIAKLDRELADVLKSNDVLKSKIDKVSKRTTVSCSGEIGSIKDQKEHCAIDNLIANEVIDEDDKHVNDDDNKGEETYSNDKNNMDRLIELKTINEPLKIEIENLKSTYEVKLQESNDQKNDLLNQLNTLQKNISIDCQKCLELMRTIELMKTEISNLQISINFKDEKLLSVESELKTLNEECNSYKSSLSKSNEQCQELAKQLSDLKDTIVEFETGKEMNLNVIAKLESDLKEQSIKFENLEKISQIDKTELTEMIDQMQQEHEGLVKEIEILNKTIEDSNLKIETQMQELNQVQDALNHANEDANIFKETIESFKLQTDSLTTENKILSDELSEVKDKKIYLENLHDHKTKELQCTLEQLSDFKSQLDTKNTELIDLNSQMSDLTQSIKELEISCNEKTSHLQIVEDEKIKLNNEIETLAELKDSLELELRESKSENEQKREELSTVKDEHENVLTDLKSKFNALDCRCKELEAGDTLWSNRCTELDHKLKSMEDQLLKEEDRFQSISTELGQQITKLQTENQTNLKLQTNLEEEIATRDSELRQLSDVKSKLEEDLNFKIDELSLARDEKERLDGLCNANKLLVCNLNEVIGKLKKSESDLKESNLDLLNRLDETREILNSKISDMQGNIDSLKLLNDTKELKINDLKTDLESKSIKIFNIESEIEKFKKDQLECEIQISNKEQTISKLQSTLIIKDIEISELESQNVDKESKIKDMESQLLSKDKEIINLEDLCSTKEKELMRLENDLRENELNVSEVKQQHQSKLAEVKELQDHIAAYKVALTENEDLLKIKSEHFERLKLEMGVTESQLKATEEINLKAKSCLERECADLLKQLDRKEERLAEVSMELKSKDSELQRATSELQVREGQCKKEISDLTVLNKKLSKEKNWFQLRNEELATQLQDLRSNFKQEVGDRLADQKAVYEEKMRDYEVLLEKMNTLQEQCDRWKFMFEDLTAKIEPFKDQLEQFELEKQALLSRNKNAQLEVDKLSKEYARVLGHQNHKQKIHHMVKLKDENLALKSEVENLRAKEHMNRKRIEKLTEKLDALEGRRRFDTSLAFKNSSVDNFPEFPIAAINSNGNNNNNNNNKGGYGDNNNNNNKGKGGGGGWRLNSTINVSSQKYNNSNNNSDVDNNSNNNVAGDFQQEKFVTATFSNVAKENDGRKYSLAYSRGSMSQGDNNANDTRKYSMSSSSSSSSRNYLKEGNR